MRWSSRRELTFAAMRNENVVVTEFGRWRLSEFVNFRVSSGMVVRAFEPSLPVTLPKVRSG